MRKREFLRAGASALGLASALALAGCSSASGPPAGRAAGAGLRHRIEAAQNPSGYLIKTTAMQAGAGGHGPSSVTTVWTDPATGNAMLRRGSGSARVANWERDYYRNRVLHWDQTQVNYGPRTWWTADQHAPAPAKGPRPAGSAGGGYTPAALVPAVLGQAAATIVGYPVVGGRRTIELSVARPQAHFDIWADSRSYRVIRMVKYFRGGMRVPPITSDFDWVRSTTAMVHLINAPQVPAGFTQVRVGQYYAANRRDGSG